MFLSDGCRRLLGSDQSRAPPGKMNSPSMATALWCFLYTCVRRGRRIFNWGKKLYNNEDCIFVCIYYTHMYLLSAFDFLNKAIANEIHLHWNTWIKKNKINKRSVRSFSVLFTTATVDSVKSLLCLPLGCAVTKCHKLLFKSRKKKIRSLSAMNRR